MEALHAGLMVALLLPNATVETPNFVVYAPTHEFAQQVGQAAEYYRKELAIEWTGQEMPRWTSRCPIRVKVGNYGAGGATSFNFDRGQVYGWNMNVEGSAERILDSVLPHEVNHTIFACYFRRPLPRWADEGAASLIEHESERMRLKKIHEQVMHSTRKIPLRKLLPMREYPSDTQQVLTLYAEGYSLADFLIQQSSKQQYLDFVADALERGWQPAFAKHYRYEQLDDVERDFDRWILAGSPDLNSPEGTKLALNGRAHASQPVIRAQSEDVAVNLGSQGQWPASEPVEPLSVPNRVKTAATRTRAALETPLGMSRSTAGNERPSSPRAALEVPLLRFATATANSE